jgi:Spy/CpxP family protein refolding chaperone
VSATKTTLLAVLVVVMTFAAGFAAGMFTDHMMIVRRGGRLDHLPFAAQMMSRRLDHTLDLSAAQRIQIEAILEKRRARFDAIHESIRPSVEKEIAQTNAEIERVLTPEQREKYGRMKMRLRRQFHGRAHMPPR